MNTRFFLFGRLAAAIVLLAASTPARAGAEPPADLVLFHGKIVTMDKGAPSVQALAVRGNRIIALGTDVAIRPLAGPATRVIDLQGRLAIPGFIESHAHFTGIGEARLKLDLTKAKNWDEIVAMVADKARRADPGDWILGRGWHQEKWDARPEPNIDGLPFHQALSRVSPDNPVLLAHASGHSSLANAKAMELAGVDAKTPDPRGGEIVRDEQGSPIGAFRETAQGLIERAHAKTMSRRTPAEQEADEIEVIRLAAEECLSKGITCFHDAGASYGTIDIYKELAEQGRLGVRLYAMISAGDLFLGGKLTQYRIIGAGEEHLTVRSVKLLIDGALGAHGAWLLEPYADLPGSTGLNTIPVKAMKQAARLAIENDFQVCTHAIGDRANRETLDIYEEAFAAHPGKKDLRWRIEHAQHLDPDDVPRFGRLGVVAAMQGIHCTSDGPWVTAKIGEARARTGAYVWRDLMRAGAVISNGTDAPVEDVDPIPGFYASVTRRMNNGRTFFPEQRLTREETLASYTINGAYAGFQEDKLGSLAVGKLADITVLSKDIMTVAEEEILDASVVMTIVGGRILYQQE